jgi:hypothetical protein
MKGKTRKQQNGIRRGYDSSRLKGGVRGKYAARCRAGTNLVLLSPDVAEHFPDDRAVNAALRKLIRVTKRPARRSRRIRFPSSLRWNTDYKSLR